MIYHEITAALRAGMPVFPGDPLFEASAVGGDSPFAVTRLCLGSHTGTHVDAPSHLIPGGRSVDQIPLDTLLGSCLVIDLAGHPGSVDARELKRVGLKGHCRVLLRTVASPAGECGKGTEVPAPLTLDGARFLVEHGVRLVGIDAPTIEDPEGDGSVHRALLEADVVILEGIDLSAVERGEYELLCLPLRLAGGDGAPCRAVLRREEPPASRPEHHTRYPR